MIKKTFKFDGYHSKFLGRNGSFKCSGLSLGQFESPFEGERPFIEIRPITSKGQPGKCFIEVPISHMRELINALTEIETEWIDKEQEGL